MLSGGVRASVAVNWAARTHVLLHIRVCHDGRRERPCILRLVCLACAIGKAAVSHPQAGIACYHGSHTAGTPPLYVLLFFFNLPLFLFLLFLLLHLLFVFFSDSQMTPHHHQ